MVALFDRGDAGTDVDDDAGAFVAEDGGKQAFRVGAREREFVGVANAGRLDLDQHFAGARAVELDRRHFQRLAGRISHGGANIHAILTRVWLTMTLRGCDGKPGTGGAADWNSSAMHG